jgi:hypothetical protein
MSAMAVEPMAIPMTARFHIGSTIQWATGDAGYIRRTVNMHAEIMNVPKPVASIKYSGQWCRNFRYMRSPQTVYTTSDPSVE